jgi:hypothetical protein
MIIYFKMDAHLDYTYPWSMSWGGTVLEEGMKDDHWVR